MKLRDELLELLHKVCIVLSAHPDELNVKDVAALIGAYAQLEGACGDQIPQRVEVVMSEDVERWSK